ncbi:Auxin-responsive protein SAUR36 [Dichanthelium oligosanthes]|uniref:Auxin-responsive protein SAUR36 n=1 Tax=Dichanthelium oligosanthes TaxID=888268 RepID=A0A1E5WK05_9POAL|nr:Auxin-responsive protein SAUR36 [Dichanthelium oligosanthes]
MAYSMTAASQGSVIRPSSPAKPNSSRDIRRSSAKTAVLRHASGTSNRAPSSVYTAQWPLLASEHSSASFAAAPQRLTPTPTKEPEGSSGPSTSMASKGHCVVYSADGRRFEVPLAYLGTVVFGELLMLSQEEFGFASEDGKITLPCDAVVVDPLDSCTRVELLGNGQDHEHGGCDVARRVWEYDLDEILGVECLALARAGRSVVSVLGFGQHLCRDSHAERKGEPATMISAKRLAQMARKRLMPIPAKESEESCSTSTSVAGKGHCVVYSADGRRFEVPLAYLGTVVFGELLMLSQEEFGFTSDDGRIMLPCDAAVVEYVMSLLRRNASEEVVRAFLSSMVRPCHPVSGVAPCNRQLSVWA